MIYVTFVGAIARSYSYFGRGNGTVLLNELQCNGEETNVVNCTHPGIAVVYSSCNHGTDAGVECPGLHYIVGVHLVLRYYSHVVVQSYSSSFGRSGLY